MNTNSPPAGPPADLLSQVTQATPAGGQAPAPRPQTTPADATPPDLQSPYYLPDAQPLASPVESSPAESATVTPANPPPHHRKKKGPPPPPITAGRVSKSGAVTGRKGIAPHIIYHFGDTGKFHPLSEIIATVDPAGSKAAFTTALGIMKRSHTVGVEMRPGARGDNHYRFSTKVERLISLTEIETKFDPLIADLLQQAGMPISHQSADRFRAAAAALKRLLREWDK